jgi:hypothetical protein
MRGTRLALAGLIAIIPAALARPAPRRDHAVGRHDIVVTATPARDAGEEGRQLRHGDHRRRASSGPA